jgi:hypothetical protein
MIGRTTSSKDQPPRPKRTFGDAENRQKRGIPEARSERLVSPLPSEKP